MPAKVNLQVNLKGKHRARGRRPVILTINQWGQDSPPAKVNRWVQVSQWAPVNRWVKANLPEKDSLPEKDNLRVKVNQAAKGREVKAKAKGKRAPNQWMLNWPASRATSAQGLSHNLLKRLPP
jgi:hypothetical protein